MTTFKCLFVAGVTAALIAGCSGSSGGLSTGGAVPASGTTSPGNRHPMVLQNGKAPIYWTQFPAPTSGFSVSYAIAQGADKNMWFSNGQDGLLQVTMTGAKKLFPMTYLCNGSTSCNYYSGYGMTVGTDKKFYMTGQNYDYTHSRYIVGTATTAGVLTFNDIPSGDYGGNGGLTKGPDGNVWFTEQRHVGMITTAGAVTEYNYPSGATSNSDGSVTTGPDGNVWFTEYNNNIVGKIVPSTGVITEYSLSTSGLSCAPAGIVAAPDGNLYFGCTGNELGEITTTGSAKDIYDPWDVSYLPEGIIVGPDGNPWFSDENGAYIGEYNPATGGITTYVPPYSTGTVYSLAVGPDHNVWGEDNASPSHIDVYIVDTLTVSPATIKFTAIGQMQNITVTEPSQSSWTAKSSSPGVATVATTGKANVFAVTSKGAGSTNVTVADKIGNSFVVKVTVK